MQRGLWWVWSVIIFIVLPLVSNALPHEGLIVLEVLAAFTLVIKAVEWCRQKETAFVWGPTDSWLFALIAAGALSLIWCPSAYRGMIRLEELILLFVVYRIYVARNPVSAVTFALVVGIGVVATSVFAILQYSDVFFMPWGWSPWGSAFGKRVFAGLGNPNWLASYLVLTLPLVLAGYLHARGWGERITTGAALALGMAVLFLTKSFAGWGGAAVAVAVFLTYNRWAKGGVNVRRRLLQGAVVAFLAIALFVVTETPNPQTRVRNFIERLLRYRTAVDMIKDHPLTGVGLGNYPVLADSYVARVIGEQRFEPLWEQEQSTRPMIRDRVENEWLDHAAELGLPGVVLWIGFVATLFMGAGRRVEAQAPEMSAGMTAAALGAVAGSLVDALFGFPLHVVPAAAVFFSCVAMASPGAHVHRFVRPDVPAAVIRLAAAAGAVIFLFIAINKTAGERYMLRAQAMKDAGNFPAAMRNLDLSRSFNPFDPRLDLEAGIVSRVLGDYGQAVGKLNRFISVESEHMLALYNRGLAFELKGDFDRALADYRAASQLKPRFALLKLAMARVNERLGKGDAAKEQRRQAAELSQGLPKSEASPYRGSTREERIIDMHFDRAARYVNVKAWDLAAAEYAKVLALDPGNADAVSDIGVVYLQKGSLLRGVVQLREALKIAPNHKGAQQSLAAVEPLLKARGISEPSAGMAFMDVPILMYHKIGNTPSKSLWWVTLPDFTAQMKYLKSAGYETVSLEDVAKAREGKKKLPARPVVITFDDGFKNLLTDAAPVLKSLGFKASFFLVTSQVGAAGHPPYEPAQEPDAPFMTWKEAKELVKAGFEPGGHSATHNDLRKKTPDVLRKEIADSQKVMAKNLGVKPSFFAYPFGHGDDAVIKVLQSAGYKGALMADGGIEEITTADFYRLRRVQVLGGQSLMEFVMSVNPQVPAPAIGVTDPQVMDPSTEAAKKEFNPGDTMRLKLAFQNLGDDVAVSLVIHIEERPSAEGRGAVVFDQTYGTKRQPIQLGFESAQEIDMTVPLPKDLRPGRLWLDFEVKNADGTLEYLTVHGKPLAEIQAAAPKTASEHTPVK